MTFERAATPFGQGRSREAIDFGRRATQKLLPWIREHYELYTSDQANFTPGGLFNYHLRGDYALQLTTNNPDYEPTGLYSANPGRLVLEASPVQVVFNFPASIDLANRLQTFANTHAFGGGGLVDRRFGVMGASDTVAAPQPEHFFAREVANGSILTEFLFAEQATLAYRLLPYEKDFHTKVRNFLVNESMHFIENIRLLTNGRGNNQFEHIAHGFNLDLALLGPELDRLFVAAPNTLGTINMPGGIPNINFAAPPLNAFATWTDLWADPTTPKPTFVLPICYVIDATTEYINLNAAVAKGVHPDTDAVLWPVYQDLLREAIIASYQIGGYYTINPGAPGPAPGAVNPSHLVLDNTNHFTAYYRQQHGGAYFLCSQKADNFNPNNVRNRLGNFFDTYFNLVNTPFPVGTIVQFNIHNNNAVNEANTNQVTPPIPRANLVAHITGPNNNLFRITGTNPPIRQRNRPNIRRYQMESVDDTGATRGLELQNIREFWRTDQGEIPSIFMHRPANFGVNDQSIHTPLNLVGRTLLSSCYYIFNIGAYYSARRDMRKLTKRDAPGHYPPLNEAMQAGVANNAARNGHQPNHEFGVLDLYSELRADLMADYLAAMYDNLKGSYRDQFEAFYTGDFHSNELDYYTSAVSNYIDPQVMPEDANREQVLVGPRLTTRLPQETTLVERQRAVYPANHPDVLAGLATAGDPLPVQSHRQVQNFRSADPELVYYQMDSPLLREILRELNEAFYQWYVTLAEDLDRGARNLLRAGNLEADDPTQRALLVRTGRRGDPGTDRRPIRPTKLILDSMWPLLTTRATNAVESGEVPAHNMLRRIAVALTQHRTQTSMAIPAVPISLSSVNFGELLRSPTQYALPPSTSAEDVKVFLDYLSNTYYNDYGLIGLLAANIETERTELYTQDQLIAAFKKQYKSFRDTLVLNRFHFSATAEVILAFRRMIATDPNARAIEAATLTTSPPGDPVEQAAPATPIPEPMRRI